MSARRLILSVLAALLLWPIAALGQTGDEGIAGIINEDQLGLEVIYIQAKRWKPSKTVGSSELREFVGSLVDRNATTDRAHRGRRGPTVRKSRHTLGRGQCLCRRSISSLSACPRP